MSCNTVAIGGGAVIELNGADGENNGSFVSDAEGSSFVSRSSVASRVVLVSHAGDSGGTTVVSLKLRLSSNIFAALR